VCGCAVWGNVVWCGEAWYGALLHGMICVRLLIRVNAFVLLHFNQLTVITEFTSMISERS
jgi:hypothetical protein